MCAACRASFSTSQSSSLSWKAIQSPRASATPVLRAAAAPRFRAWRTTRTLGAPSASTAAAVPSPLASSTTITSMLSQLCASTPEIARPIERARL